MWTRFWDMHSGGSLKEKPYSHIYIEAPKEEACLIFFNRYGHNPNRVTCTCCGEDYSIDTHESLAQLTGFERGCQTLKVPQDDQGLYQNDDPIIVAHMYLEDGEKPPNGYIVEKAMGLSALNHGYQPLKDYLMRDDVDLILAQDI